MPRDREPGAPSGGSMDRVPRPAPRVRPSDPADAPALAALRWEFRTALEPEVTPERGFRERCAAWMAARLARPDQWRCWLAEDDAGVPLGTVWVQFLEKLPNPVHEPELHAYLTSFYVRPAARNGGVGSALLEAALAACAARCTDTVFLWPRNEAARSTCDTASTSGRGCSSGGSAVSRRPGRTRAQRR